MILVSKSQFVGQYAIQQTHADGPILQSYIDREEKSAIYKLLGRELGDLLVAYISAKTSITTGPLIIDQYYTITTLVAGDDFTNVGAPSNTAGITFKATGTTPTTYSNGSRLTLVTPRYEAILNPFYLDNDTGRWFYGCFDSYYQSTGLLDLLLLQIYYCFVSEEQVLLSQSGAAIQSAESATVQSPQNALRKVEQKWNVAGVKTWKAIQWICTKDNDVYPEFKGIREGVRYSSVM